MAQRQSTHACSFHSYWQISELRALNSTPRSTSAMETTRSERQNPGFSAVSDALGPSISKKKPTHLFASRWLLTRVSWQIYVKASCD